MSGTVRALGSRYELAEQIGQGASGAVWRAWDRRDQKPVAAKLLWPQYARDEEVLTRFIRERTILTSLRHPNIVNVTDMVVEGDQIAIIMDLVQGPSLAHERRRRGGTLPAELAVAYTAAVLDALAHAHAQGVLHRDVKADNILLAAAEHPQPADVRLADFGIARLTHDTAARTETIGTPYYMAPELIVHGKSGPQSDVYAAGVVLYELLAGRTPYAGEGTDVTVSLRHLQSCPPAIPVAASLWSVLEGMLAKDPARRLSADDTARALRGVPDHDLTAGALPVQPEPDAWEDSAETLPAKQDLERILGYQTSTGDNSPADATSIRARQPLRRPDPTDLEEPEPTPVAPGGLTQVKAAPRPHSPVAAPVAPKRRLPLLVGGGIAVVLAITVLVLWLTGVFGGPAEPTPEPTPELPPVTTTSSHITGKTLPTGLRLDFDAAYNASDSLTALTLTLSATPVSGLSGDVLLDVPSLTDGTCPTVTAPPAFTVQPLKASTDGFTGVCALKLVDLHIDPGGSVRVELAVGLDMYALDDKPPDSYDQWLEAVSRTTDDDLRAITGARFPLQRVTGIAVQADSVTLTEVDGTPVTYSVWARWAGQSETSSPTQILSSDTITGMETVLLLGLTGGAGLSAVTVDTCDATTKTGIRILARQPTTRCDLQVRVGTLTAPTTAFTITMR